MRRGGGGTAATVGSEDRWMMDRWMEAKLWKAGSKPLDFALNKTYQINMFDRCTNYASTVLTVHHSLDQCFSTYATSDFILEIDI